MCLLVYDSLEKCSRSQTPYDTVHAYWNWCLERRAHLSEEKQRKKTWLMDDPEWLSQLALKLSVEDMTLMADEGPHVGQTMHLERDSKFHFYFRTGC